MLEMLPTPWGLVRSGVAPDHPEDQVDQRPVREDRRPTRGSGSSATSSSASTSRPTELAERYDAVIYAVGAQSDRPLGIPGEDLPGSVAAVDFVGWYNAHPHFEEMTPDLSAGRAVVIGNGNVALDVARILVSDPDALAATDIADHALESLHARGVEEVRGHRPARTAAGHRSPRWSCANSATSRAWRRRRRSSIPADFADITDEDLEAAGKTVKQNIKVLRGYAERDAARSDAPHRVPVPHLADRDQGRRPGRVDRAGPQRAGRRRRARRRQGHRRARGAARAAGGPRRRLSRGADARAAVRRADGHHPAHRRADRGQPQRVRGRLDQARPLRRHRQQQEGFAGDRRHAGGRPGRGARWPTSARTIRRSWSSGCWSGNRSSSPTTTGS